MKLKYILALAIIALAAVTLNSQQVGPTATVFKTNVTERVIRVKVTTTQIVERKAAPVVFQGKTNWLTSDTILKETSVTNAIADPTLRGGLKGLNRNR